MGATPWSHDETSAHVLVVDDDEAVRSSTADVLRSAGHSVIEAGDGQDALRQLDRHRVGALVLDIRMPKLDGMAVLAAVEELPPVIVFSAFDLDHVDLRPFGNKIFQQVQKPLAPDLLIALVGRALNGGPSAGEASPRRSA
ncbi:MAG TPA: response regulator [Acidimicrobiales bacterium]|nr:response regulator [Acidimicrobiales bacterium]